MALRLSLSEIKRWVSARAARGQRRKLGLQRIRLQGEPLEIRALFTANVADSWYAADHASVVEPSAIVLDAQGESASDGVVLESLGADLANMSDPAPPPGTTSENVLLEKPFLSGTLVVSRPSPARVEFIYVEGGRTSTAYRGTASFYEYVDTPVLLTIFATPLRERGSRIEIDPATGDFRQYAYSGNANSFLSIRDTVFDTATRRARSGLEQYYDLTGPEPRLIQRVTPNATFGVASRIEHFAEDGSSLVYEQSRPGFPVRVQFSGGGQSFDFVGEALLQPSSPLRYSFIKMPHTNAAGLKEFVSFTLAQETIEMLTQLEDTVLESLPFGTSRAEIVQRRTLESSNVELRARVVASNDVPGGGHGLIYPQIDAYEISPAGALVIRYATSTKTFLASGQFEEFRANGAAYSKQISQLRAAGDRVWLDSVREDRGTLLGESLELQQSRHLSVLNGEPWEVLIRFERGSPQLIWARPLSGRQPGLIVYWTAGTAQVVELVSVENPAFDTNMVLQGLKGVERYEDNLRQINVEAVFESEELRVSVTSAPRPVDIQTAFGDGKMIVERRSDGRSFLHLFDAAGRVLLEQQVVAFRHSGTGVEIEDGTESYVIHSDGRITTTASAWAGLNRLTIDETRRFVASGDGQELLPTERKWRLADRDVQKETFAYSSNGQLLSTHISRNPREFLEVGESPTATLELTVATDGPSTLFLYHSRTGQLRDSTARRILFADPPELTRGANGLVNVVSGYEKSLAGGEQLVEIGFNEGQTRFSEQIVVQTFFGNATDNRLGVASVLQTIDRNGDRRFVLRLSGQPSLAERSTWHPFDLFLAAQPLVEYEIVSWRLVGEQLFATRTDGTELTLRADEQSPLVDEVRSLDTDWGRLTIATTYRPLYGYGQGSELTLAPIAREIRGADGRVWQAEQVVYQSVVIGEPTIISRQIEWQLTDGRHVEYRQQGTAHILRITDPADPNAAKLYRFLEAPVLIRRNDADLATGIFCRVAGPLGDESFVLPLV